MPESRAQENQRTRQICIVKFVKCINTKLEDLQLEIVKQHDEESLTSSSLILVNRRDCSEDGPKLTINAMVTFSKVELIYLKILIKYIMESEYKEISQTLALNKISDLPSGVNGFTQENAEAVIKKGKTLKLCQEIHIFCCYWPRSQNTSHFDFSGKNYIFLFS